jgi:hypothetical protein
MNNCVSEYVIGFDPGGAEKFGWSILHWRGNGCPLLLERNTTSSARGALDAVESYLERGSCKVVAIGIDAPLYWIDGDAERAVDVAVRLALQGRTKCSVIHVNSLRGACLAQGMMLANLVARHSDWSDFVITEAHPVALASLYLDAIPPEGGAHGHITFLKKVAEERRKFCDRQKDLISRRKELTKSEKSELLIVSEELHKVDATLAACAAGFGLSHGWSDLVEQREESLHGRYHPWTEDPRELHYFFPRT